MIILYIALAIILVLLILLIAIGFIIHNKAFGKRYEANPLVKLYTKEEFNLGSTLIEINYKNDIIRGNLYSYNNYDPTKLIIFCHGMWSNHNSYLQDIEYFCRNNLLVFGFDYLGVSSSTGKNIKGLGNSLKSLDIVVKYFEEKYPNKEIYVVGHSWGAFSTTNIILLHPNIKGIIALSPFISIYSCLKSFIPKNLSFLAPFIFLAEYLKNGKYSLMKTKDSLKNYKGKALILGSTDDSMISFNKNTGYIMKLYPNLNYLIFDDRGHNPNYTALAVKKLQSFQNDVKSVPSDKMVEFMNSINFHELGELDLKVMDKLIEFIKL